MGPALDASLEGAPPLLRTENLKLNRDERLLWHALESSRLLDLWSTVPPDPFHPPDRSKLPRPPLRVTSFEVLKRGAGLGKRGKPH